MSIETHAEQVRSDAQGQMTDLAHTLDAEPEIDESFFDSLLVDDHLEQDARRLELDAHFEPHTDTAQLEHDAHFEHDVDAMQVDTLSVLEQDSSCES